MARNTFGKYFESLVESSDFANRAEVAYAAGVDPGTLGRWIRGVTPPTLDKLIAVAAVLDAPVEDLVMAALRARMEALGAGGAPPAPAAPDPQIVQIIRDLFHGDEMTDKQKWAFDRHLRYEVDRYRAVVAEYNEVVELHRQASDELSRRGDHAR